MEKGSKRIIRFVVSIIITEGAGGIGSIFTFQAIPTWYASLTKTAITPPNWLFGPMWITLYFLMGVSLFLIQDRRKESEHIMLAALLFTIQLLLNILWSLLFFGFHSLIFGAVEIVFLWFFILATIIEFYQIDRRSSYLLFPYLAWVTVATMLNVTILFANY